MDINIHYSNDPNVHPCINPLCLKMEPFLRYAESLVLALHILARINDI